MQGIAFLESLPKWEKGSFSPLEIPKRVMNLLGNPQNIPKSIHVAGTNGKGTTCAAISSILVEADFNVGQCSSPHLSDVTERCLVNGVPISRKDFDSALCQVAEVVDWDTNSLTYFVACVAAFFVACRDFDWIVIETGLGGLYDATNVIESPKCCVITNIALDHCEILGETVAEIATNKAGIIKKGAAVFSSEKHLQIEQAIFSQKANWGKFQFDGDVSCQNDLVFSFSDFDLKIERPSLFLRSAFVQQNLLLACKVCLSLGVNKACIEQGIKKTAWPARMELFKLANQNQVILDGAHNPAAVTALMNDVLKFIKAEFIEAENFEKVVFLLGMRKRDASSANLITFKEELKNFSLPTDVIAFGWNDPLALSPSRINELLDIPLFIRNLEELSEILDEGGLGEGSVETKKAKTLYVGFGSLYFVSQLRAKLAQA